MKYHNANNCNCLNCLLINEQQKLALDKEQQEVNQIELKEELEEIKSTLELYQDFKQLHPKTQLITLKRVIQAVSESLRLDQKTNLCKSRGCGDCSMEWCLFNDCDCDYCVYEDSR